MTTQTMANLHQLGFVRVMAAAPESRVADISFNTEQCIAAAQCAADNSADLLVLPELCLTAYTCGDLFYQINFLKRAEEALQTFCLATAEIPLVAIVGLPLQVDSKIFNVAAVCSGGKVLGIVPKTFLPNTMEYYEKRWFVSSRYLQRAEVEIMGHSIPCGTDLIFQMKRAGEPLFRFAVEICEDLWAVVPPSCNYALAGAEVIANLSASNEILGKEEYRRSLVLAHSARTLSAYCYASAGAGESSTDLVYSGHCIIGENGTLMEESERFTFQMQYSLADIDVERLRHERTKTSSFADASLDILPTKSIPVELPAGAPRSLHREVPATLYPTEKEARAAYCREVFLLQTTGLTKRLRHIGAKAAVIGISGGLDSTLALLAVVKAFDNNGWERSGIHAITMPGFGTGKRTRSNAMRLMELLGVSIREISIDAAVGQHFLDIRHNPEIHDVVYENSQARERTQLLMDIANQVNGIVIGTGDLSELALGWCTYAGDHISMYNVNVDIPKTLVRYLVEWCAAEEYFCEISTILRDIVDTPVSPELVPAAEGELQSTEDTLGPYSLHDFFLFHIVRFGATPSKVFCLAEKAFRGQYSPDIIVRTLKTFYRRFFAHQFKRSCLPDGPKIGTVDLSPRGYWRMPSDAVATLWIEEVERLRINNEQWIMDNG